MTKKLSLSLALALALALVWAGGASAVIIAAGPFANPAQWPAAAKVNTFYGNPEVVLSFGLAQSNHFRWNVNAEDFDSSKGHPFSNVWQENTFVLVGTQPGQWKMLFMLEHEAPWSQGNEGGGSGELGLERAWVDFKLPWFKTWWMQLGNSIQNPQINPIVFVGDNHGIVLRGEFSKTARWEFAYLKIQENLDTGGIGTGVASTFGGETTTGPLGLLTTLGATNAGNALGGDNDQDIWYGYINWTVNKHQIRPYFIFNRNFVEQAVAPGAGGEWQEEQVYLGVDARWVIGPTNLMTQAIYQTGNVDRRGGFDGDINSWFLMFDWAWPIKNWTPHLGASWASGDDDPTDDDLEGFGVVTGLQPVVDLGWGGEHRFIGETTSPRGLGFFGERKNTVDFIGGPPACPAGSPRGRNGVAICKGPKFGAPFNRVGGGINADGLGLQNPGVWAINFGLDWQATKRLLLDSNLTYFQYDEGEQHFRKSLGICADTGRACRFDDSIGWEWNIGGTFRYSRNLMLDGSISMVIPDGNGAVEKIYGDDDVAFQAWLHTEFRF